MKTADVHTMRCGICRHAPSGPFTSPSRHIFLAPAENEAASICNAGIGYSSRAVTTARLHADVRTVGESRAHRRTARQAGRSRHGRSLPASLQPRWPVRCGVFSKVDSGRWTPDPYPPARAWPCPSAPCPPAPRSPHVVYMTPLVTPHHTRSASNRHPPPPPDHPATVTRSRLTRTWAG